jgi:glycosyltransferase involved in cell wall biosynthesis
MTVPRISICIPAYNADRYFEATLASVRAQTFSDWELIVVEDGSRDRTEEIVQAFGRQGPQPVRFFRHDRNQGLSATRNTGFEHAHGDVLALLDADDLWRPEHLQLSWETLEQSGADIVFSGCVLFNSDTGEPIEECAPPAGAMGDFPRSLHDGRIIIQPSAAVMRRDVIKRVGGFDTRFPICNDLEFWFHSAQFGCRFAYTGAITCDYRKHARALSKRSAELVAECASIHRLYREWTAIPAAQRRHEMWRHHRNAARMLFRKAPLRSLGLLARGHPLRVLR